MKKIKSYNVVMLFIYTLSVFQNLSVNASIFTLTAIAVDRLGVQNRGDGLRDFGILVENMEYQNI